LPMPEVIRTAAAVTRVPSSRVTTTA
jgi:hypothetical protein